MRVRRRCHASSYRRFRYEEFVARPAQILSEIAEMIGGDTPELGFLNGRKATVSAQHALAGNPDKFHDGVVTIRSAGFEISNSKKLLTTLISLPLLIRYRYAIWPR